MELQEIEHKICCGELSAAQVFTRMKQHISELSRYSMSAGMADQYKSEAIAARMALGFSADAQDVSPSDIIFAISELRETDRVTGIYKRNKIIDACINNIKSCELVAPNVTRIRLHEALGSLIELKQKQ